MLGWTFNPPPGLKIRNPTTRRGVLKLSEKPRGWLLTRRKTFSKGKGCPKKMLEDGSTSFGASFLWFFSKEDGEKPVTKRDKKRWNALQRKIATVGVLFFFDWGDKNDICPKGVSQMWKILNEKSSMTGGRSKKPRSSQKGCTNTNHFAEPPPLRHLEMEWVFCPLVFLVIKKYLGRGLHEHHRVPGPIPPGSWSKSPPQQSLQRNNFPARSKKRGACVFETVVFRRNLKTARGNSGIFLKLKKFINQTPGDFFHEENPRKKIGKKNLKENVIEISWWICPDLRFCWFTGLGSVLCWWFLAECTMVNH